MESDRRKAGQTSQGRFSTNVPSYTNLTSLRPVSSMPKSISRTCDYIEISCDTRDEAIGASRYISTDAPAFHGRLRTAVLDRVV